MPNYIARMQVTYKGADAYVEAADADEASSLIEEMAWTGFELSRAEMIDWEIIEIEENK